METETYTVEYREPRIRERVLLETDNRETAACARAMARGERYELISYSSNLED